jgi:hypothetical protein
MEIVMCHCNKCGGPRRHAELAKEEVVREVFNDGQNYVYESNTYWFLKCEGCESGVLKHAKYFSEDEESTVFYYPARLARQRPEWLWQLWEPEVKYIADLLGQVYDALAAEANMLAAMGVRSLLEHLMIANVGDQGSFVNNLAAFAEAGYVAPKERDRLEKIFELGHAATHRSFRPSPQDTFTLVDIAEHLIASIYVHDGAVERASSRVPPRIKPAKKPKAGKTP